MRRWFIVIAITLLLGVSSAAMATSKAYFYPYVNPLEATVMELPSYYHADVPENIPTRTFKVYPYPDREIPKVFWYKDGLVCSLTPQKKEAPLAFVIAGTGARHNSPKVVNLHRALYQAGYHVLSITSPTHMDFIITASSTMTPGNLFEDAKDIYAVMKLAMAEVKDDIEISDYYLTGYSLGGIQSAFVSMLDEEEKAFDFKRVLLINPPVNLYTSVNILDSMLTDNIPGGINNIDKWFDEIMNKLAAAEKSMGHFELNGENIYKVYKRFPPREDFLASLIGVSFRTDSASMMFAADVMKGGGFITPKDVEMTNSTALTPYYIVANRTSFNDYFKDHFMPYFQKNDPTLTEEKMIKQLSLRRIEPYLKSARKIGLLHNEDDVIMAPGEIGYLEQVFGSRAKIFPTGGHCGNMNHQDAVDFIVQFFAGQEG